MPGKIVQLEITDLAFDGKSVSHLDGKVVFLDGGLPGETVIAEITRSKPRYNQATVKEITKKSDKRIPAICSHFTICGGCTWQDLEYQQQLDYKKRQVTECMSRLGGHDDPDVRDVIPSGKLFSYRNKMEFSFNVAGANRDNGFTLGLHVKKRFDEVFDLEKCHLQSETANRVIPIVRDFVSEKSIPVYDVLNHTGFMRFVVIRETTFTKQLMVNIVTNYGSIPDCDILISRLSEEVPELTTVVHSQNGQKSNVATAEIETLLYGPDFIEEELLGLRFMIRSGSFFQTNSTQAELLYRTAFNLLQPGKDDRLLDLYCGTGTIGLLLADSVKEVVGVELVPDAISIARKNAESNSISNISFYEGHVKNFLKSLSPKECTFNIVIIDPPRAGLHPKALKRILEFSPVKLLYISCNPATFARDSKELTSFGYQMSEVIPVDMFPHTKHIELVCLFSKEINE